MAETWLSQEAYDRLTAELEQLTTEGREHASAEIETARAHGDLKENAEYHSAKEEQGKMEARIRQLEHLLQYAVVGEAPPDDGVVEPGMVVTVEIFGDEETFLLGSREILDEGKDLDVYSERSPLGSAINGKSAGETTTYEAPNGKTIEVTIISATPYQG